MFANFMAILSFPTKHEKESFTFKLISIHLQSHAYIFSMKNFSPKSSNRMAIPNMNQNLFKTEMTTKQTKLIFKFDNICLQSYCQFFNSMCGIVQ